MVEAAHHARGLQAERRFGVGRALPLGAGAVKEGVGLSVQEALTALLSKYLDCVVAVEQAELEIFFGNFVARSRVKDAVNALLAARELSFVHVERPIDAADHPREGGSCSASHLAFAFLSAPPSRRTSANVLTPETQRRPVEPRLPPVREHQKSSSLRVQSRPLARVTDDADNLPSQQPPRRLIIAIDGPAGAGKSTVASRWRAS